MKEKKKGKEEEKGRRKGAKLHLVNLCVKYVRESNGKERKGKSDVCVL